MRYLSGPRATHPRRNLAEGVEKSMIRKEDVLDFVRSRDFDVLIVLGAGDLDNYVPQIAEIIKQK